MTQKMRTYLGNVGDDLVHDAQWRQTWRVAHLPPYLVRDGVALVHVEGDPLPEDQVHHGRVGESNHGLHDQVRPAFIWNIVGKVAEVAVGFQNDTPELYLAWRS